MATEAEDHESTAESDAKTIGSPEGGPNQQHLKEVHKNYRVIEKSRQQYHGESENIMRRQDALLATLRTENQMLRDKVESYYLPDVSRETTLLQAEAEQFNEMIESESKRLEGLEAALGDSYSELQEAKQTMGGIFAARDKHRRAVIRTAITENRLQKAMVDLNVVEKQNKALKRKMEELSDERKFYDNVRANMERELEVTEKSMEERIQHSNQYYEERSDFEERITDIHEISTDMQSFDMWREMEGWATMDPDPLAKVINPADQNTAGERGKPPNECTEKHRKWIELKALANIQDIFDIDDWNEVVQCVQKAQQENNALYDLVNQLLKVLNEADGKLQESQIKISVGQSTRSGLINRKLDMESTLEAILDLLKDLDLTDEEFLPIIREMKSQVGAVFKEAGCNVEEDEVEYAGEYSTVRYKSGKSLPLEVAIVEFFVTIEHFIDQLSGTLR